MSTFWLQNTSFVRLKNLQFGYTLPASLINSIGISNARVYYSAENLFTIDNMPISIDPENNSERASSYPIAVSYTHLWPKGLPWNAHKLVEFLEVLFDVGYLGGAPVEVSAVSFKMKPIPRTVSYTHLDVYKRQPWNKWLIALLRTTKMLAC